MAEFDDPVMIVVGGGAIALSTAQELCALQGHRVVVLWRRDPDFARAVKSIGNPAGFMQAARFIAEAEMPLLAAGLTMPVLMIQGEEDRVTPAATNAEPLAAALPHARLVMLACCGHLPEVEFPWRVNDLIAAHLS